MGMKRNDVNAPLAEPLIDRGERQGSMGLTITLIILLVGTSAGFAFMKKEAAEPYVLILLALLAVVGVFSLFASAIGVLSFASKIPCDDLARSFVDSMNGRRSDCSRHAPGFSLCFCRGLVLAPPPNCFGVGRLVVVLILLFGFLVFLAFAVERIFSVVGCLFE